MWYMYALMALEKNNCQFSADLELSDTLTNQQ